MKIKEFLEKLDELSMEERQDLIHKLLDRFSPVSLSSLNNFQRKWISEDQAKGIQRPFEDFVKAQNQEIRMCAEMEASEFGNDVRFRMKLDKFDLEQEI